MSQDAPAGVDPFDKIRGELAGNGAGLPMGGAVILNNAPKSIDYTTLEIPIGSQCLCGETNVTLVPYMDLARSAAGVGFAWSCDGEDGCGAQWAIAAELKTQMIMIAKPTEVLE